MDISKIGIDFMIIIIQLGKILENLSKKLCRFV